jgi:hypothetical protein
MDDETEIQKPVAGILATISKPAETPGVLPTGTNAAKPDAADSGKESREVAANVSADLLASRRNERTEKRGRHPKGCVCGNCKQSQKTGVAHVAKTSKQAAAVGPVVTEIDRQIAREAIKAATHLMDSFSVLCVVTVAKKKGADNATLNDATEKATMPKETRDGIATTGAAVLEKYNAVRFAPELACGLYISAWLSGLIMTLVGLSRLPEKDEMPAKN